MPGRQAHGRAVTVRSGAGGKGKGAKRTAATSLISGPQKSGAQRSDSKPRRRSSKKALDAYAIAEQEHGDRMKLTPRNRELDAELDGGGRAGRKHARDEDDSDGEDEDDGDGDGAPPRKTRRAGGDVEYGSDSSGNEWALGAADDDDSDIESDEAFGESDEERFEDFRFRGSRKKQGDEEDDDEDIDDVDGASLGSDAIDLAAALDMSMSEDDAQPDGEQEDSDEDEESDEGESGSSDDSSDVEGDEDDVSESEMKAWASQFAGTQDDDREEESAKSTKPKVSLKDLGLLGIKDPALKKSLKLMGKEEKSTKPQKLEVPLARRQQAKLDRSAAYEKTNESLSRWMETVKHNRRADHISFPLAQNETGLARHDNTELQPLNQKSAGTELEQTILAIMEESGLGPSAEKEQKAAMEDGDVDGDAISRKALWQQRRRERELQSREDARAKRIKKIKSKAYHRVHRKQRERDEIKEHEARVEAGEVDSEEEREARDRQRAMERMGGRHKDSKWAKLSNRNGRAAWDDDVRMGVVEMARRDEELRRRLEGKPAGEDDESDDDSAYSGDSEDADDKRRLLRQLNDASATEDGVPRSKLMNMEFMKKSEAAKKKANDEMVAQIRRELGSDAEEDQDDSANEADDIGRQKFGLAPDQKAAKPNERRGKTTKKDGNDGAELQEARYNFSKPTSGHTKKILSATSAPERDDPDSIAGAWSQPTMANPSRKRRDKKGAPSSTDVLDLGPDSVAVAVAPPPPAAAPKRSKKPSTTRTTTKNDDDVSSDEEESHMPVRFREQDLIEKAFGGLDVVAEFEAEKAAVAEEEDEQVVDNTLPGWGSWVGEGVSNREKKRHQGRFLTKKEGVKKEDRRDAKMKNVIINEKRNKKNDKYLASQLPHMYESRSQYERSLRLPIGPEWVTKETFQEATKPRVLVRQGVVIAPVARPTR
ncbi:small-subunit processome [Xylariaceae sp. FL0804]|nr:small-subunit processome [Xylariaceae sp. FL0804]